MKLVQMSFVVALVAGACGNGHAPAAEKSPGLEGTWSVISAESADGKRIVFAAKDL